ncbi:MAG: LysR family transcriptional regulator [Pseudomonadota bacterium]
MKKLDWEDLKFLGAVAAHRTVRASAKHLGVHHSTVSRRIDSLEHAVGTRLVFRSPEGYTLTDAGEVMVGSANAMATEVDRARRLVDGGDRELTGHLVVSMAETVAVHAFAPRFAEFHTRYPRLELSIVSTTRMVDLARQQADVVIRMSNKPDESLFGKKLLTYNNAAYASADYLSRVDPASPDGGARWIGWDGSRQRPSRWRERTPYPDLPVWGDYPALDMQAAMARAGLGLAYLPCFIGDQDPALVRASAAPPQVGLDIWVLTHVDLRNTSRVRAFMQFAEDVIVSNRALFEGSAA